VPQFQAQFTFQGVNAFQIPGYGGDIEFNNRVFTLADTHVFNSNLINEARFGFSRIDAPSTPQEPFTGSQFGISNPLCAGNPAFCGMPTISVTNGFSLGSTSLADQRSTVETYQFSDMLSWTHGRHFVRVGGEMRHYRVNFFFNFFSRGSITFNTFKDFLQGTPANGLLGAGIRDRHYRSTDGAWYVQDDWRVTDSLTVNLGMRFGRNGGISDTDGRLSNFDPAEFAAIGHPCTTVTPCTTNNGFHLLKAGDTLNPDDWYAAPRFGFAWKPTKSGNFVTRGGFGVYFDRFSTRLANVQVFNYPTDVVGLLFGAPFGPATFANPFPNLATVQFPTNGAIPSPVTFSFLGLNLPLPISGIYVDKNFRTPYVYQYNFGVQYEPVKNWLVDIGYVGSTGRKLINVETLSQGATGTAPYNASPGAFSTNKLLTAGFQLAQSNANSNYNSLQASLTKRFSNGLQFLASYTYSKSLDYNSGQSGAGNELAVMPGDQQNMDSQYGVSDFDRPHRFVLSGLYDLPKFYNGDSGLVKRVLNDWEITSIVTLQSGSPFSVTCTSGSATYNYADLTGTDYKVNGDREVKLGSYFNRNAFKSTCANTPPYGTSRRNFLRGWNQKNVDFGIVKFIPVTERQKVEFRAELFNAFNLVNFANPISSYVSGSQGLLGSTVQTSTGPRVVQFALKYSF
jgi:hypothetical protein